MVSLCRRRLRSRFYSLSRKGVFIEMNYQWYPGHMTKARRMMQEDVKLIDLLIELVDARVPLSSRNPEIDKLGAGKGRMVLLNKSDLADPRGNQEWMSYFKGQGITVVEINSKNGTGMKAIQNAVNEACKEKRERDKKRGILNRPIRAMVVGIPNVGKSTFINAYAGKACTKTGNKPGVTKGKQWIRLGKGLELLDTPGILWPKFEDQEVGMRLAFIGSINDEILIEDELAMDFIAYVKDRYPEAIAGRYSIEGEKSPLETLEAIAKVRGCYKKGQEIDYSKAASILMDDFRSGRLGRMTLEYPVKAE